MPFQSEKQRRFLWAAHPEIAKRWAHKYPESNKGLPMYADKKDSTKSKEKAAALNALHSVIAQFSGNSAYLAGNVTSPEFAKKGMDSILRVDIPHSDTPTYAGEEREKGEQNLEETPDSSAAPNACDESDEKAAHSLLSKLSTVLAKPFREHLETQQALAEGRDPRFVPQNMGLRRYSIPSPYVTPPMGMGAVPPNASAAQGAQAAQQGMPQPGNSQQPGPVGGGSNPQHNPIQAFGPLGAKGQLNGNAAFGQKNSPDSLKTAASKLRSAFRVVQEGATHGANNMYRAFVGNVPAGLIATKTDAVSGLPQIVRSEMFDKFRGMGLGKKMYMTVAQQAGRGGLLSDVEVAPAAHRVWQSLQRRGRGVTLSPGVSMGSDGLPRMPFKELARQYADNSATAPSLYTMKVPQKIMTAWGQGTQPGLAAAAALKTAGLKDIFGKGEKLPGWYGPEGLIEIPGGGYRLGHTHGVDVVDSKPGWLRRIFDRDPYVMREDVPKYKRKLKAIRGMHVMEQPNKLEFSHMGQLKPEMRQLIEAALAKQAGAAINALGPVALGVGVGSTLGEIGGAMTAPRGHMFEGARRGMSRGAGAGAGGGAGVTLAHLAGMPLPAKLGAGAVGAYLGDKGVKRLIGAPSWQKTEVAAKQAGAESPAWQRSEGKSDSGGLNAKGRASYKAQTGGTLKAPVTESNPSGERAKRQNSFCSRMCGMKRVNTGSKTKSDPDSRINKSLRKWNCKCGSARDLLILATENGAKEAGLLQDASRGITRKLAPVITAAGMLTGPAGGVATKGMQHARDVASAAASAAGPVALGAGLVYNAGKGVVNSYKNTVNLARWLAGQK